VTQNHRNKSLKRDCVLTCHHRASTLFSYVTTEIVSDSNSSQAEANVYGNRGSAWFVPDSSSSVVSLDTNYRWPYHWTGIPLFKCGKLGWCLQKLCECYPLLAAKCVVQTRGRLRPGRRLTLSPSQHLAPPIFVLPRDRSVGISLLLSKESCDYIKNLATDLKKMYKRHTAKVMPSYIGS
jgi:hypothetical protein